MSISVAPPLHKCLTRDIVPASPSSRFSLLALKCDLRDDRTVKERLARYGIQPVQYEEGLSVARRIRASRYLGTHIASHPGLLLYPRVECWHPPSYSECSSKHNRGVTEVFYEAARVSLTTRAKGAGGYTGKSGGCVVM